MGEIDEAKALFDPLWTEFRLVAPGLFGNFLGPFGYDDEATALLAEWEAADRYIDPIYPFFVYLGLEDYDAAFPLPTKPLMTGQIFFFAGCVFRGFCSNSSRIHAFKNS